MLATHAMTFRRLPVAAAVVGILAVITASAQPRSGRLAADCITTAPGALCAAVKPAVHHLDTGARHRPTAPAVPPNPHPAPVPQSVPALDYERELWRHQGVGAWPLPNALG